MPRRHLISVAIVVILHVGATANSLAVFFLHRLADWIRVRPQERSGETRLGKPAVAPLIGVAVVAGALLLALAGRAAAQFAEGDMLSYGQADWGDTPTGNSPAVLLQANYNSVFEATSGVVELGISGAAGSSIRFTNSGSVLFYLPASGPSGPLTADFIDPISTMSGEFGGHVVALRVNVDFSDAGLLLGSTGIPYGDVVLHGFTAQPLLNGITIRQFLGQVETLLGGGSASYPIAVMKPIADDLSGAFGFGVVSPFANDHLRVGPYFADGDFITHTQADWGAAPAVGNAAELLVDHFDTVYEPFGGAFTVGRAGIIHFAMQFDSAEALADYLPASGPDMRLNADHFNPTTTNAGGFGGEVSALKLNVDFADAGLTLGAAGIALGDLVLHDLTDTDQAQFNGLSVRDFFASASRTLGTNGVGHDVSNFNAVTEQLNAAFADGGVTPWARYHLRVAGLLGDYNGDGVIDAADYTVWRDVLEGGGSLLNDPTPEDVDETDYDYWREHFGETLGSGSGANGSASASAAVPEPATIGLALVGLLPLVGRRRGATDRRGMLPRIWRTPRLRPR
jgi:hypothetical protein